MASKAKHYIGRIEEQNGEYQYSYTIRFATSGKPESLLNRIARKWHSLENRSRYLEDKGSNTYYFNGGEVAVRGGGFQQISQSAFNELTLISDFTGGI